MNFFEHQDQARRNSRVLVFLFALAVIFIAVVMNVLVLFVLGSDTARANGGFLGAHWPLMFATTLITLGVIGVASLYRTMALRGGGSEVARSLGGSRVEPGTTDPLRRRLRNVVEEIAIASGIPVPEVYVLEHEAGINAFAAGYAPTDAAVAVTRGTLENLNREELQGVIAHEFSHIFNGDMRLNIRLIGLLFGILVLALVGRRVMLSLGHSRSRDAGAAMIVALVVMLLGYIGLFFGRWIRAAVSRQRETLADASAVQFTRNPQGVAGALKKIGALNAGSELSTDTEEVGHMLFARGMVSRMFATHPPLVERIRAIEPSFQPEEFEQIAARMERHAQARAARQETAESTPEDAGPGGLTLEPGRLIEQIGQPGLGQILIAAALVAAIPEPLKRAAQTQEWSPELLCYLLINDTAEVREKQLAMIAAVLGENGEQQVNDWLVASPHLADEQRLPLLELGFPGLRQRPQAELEQLLALIDRLIHADGRVTVFEYALGRLTTIQVQDILHPEHTRAAGRKTVDNCRDEVIDLIGIVARHGHTDTGQAEAAFQGALDALEITRPPALPELDDWPDRLDAALRVLDALKIPQKRRLVQTLVHCVMHDDLIGVSERELLRTICASLHVPLPVFEQ